MIFLAFFATVLWALPIAAFSLSCRSVHLTRISTRLLCTLGKWRSVAIPFSHYRKDMMERWFLWRNWGRFRHHPLVSQLSVQTNEWIVFIDISQSMIFGVWLSKWLEGVWHSWQVVFTSYKNSLNLKHISQCCTWAPDTLGNKTQEPFKFPKF